VRSAANEPIRTKLIYRASADDDDSNIKDAKADISCSKLPPSLHAVSTFDVERLREEIYPP
jgi:hypothetical protein